MEDLLRFLKNNEVWIYVLLGLVGLWYIRKLFQALSEWRGALFGLEKDNAQRRLSEAASVLILLALMGTGEFLLVSFVSPGFPRVDAVPTPTLDILATPTVTLSPQETLPLPGTPAPAGTALAVGSVAGTAAVPARSIVTGSAEAQGSNGCIPGKLEFLDPDKLGKELKGAVILKGTVDVPDFGFYKYEFTTPGSNNWVTIAAGEELVNATSAKPNELGPWDTKTLTPGDYLLRLVVTDHQGNKLPECVIPVRVSAP